MGRNNKNPFRGKQRLGDYKAAKGAKPKSQGKRPKRQGGPWGLVAVVGAFAVFFTGKLLYDRQKQKEHLQASRLILAGMRTKPIKFTEHATCRMGCRFIPQHEVMDVLQTGVVNDKKSEPKTRPCPKYVVDAQVGSHHKNVQAVFSACRDATNVVTVIDKDTEWECYCP
ncbi:hypothetical protein WJX72_007775 [[Myrmecia] bisecta]|uniref:Uncharacterized protein n=1 Tax=[Myrmecia] bisecta TaxID=41462 RepID=A0AAW1QAG7_9CHLO